MQDPSSGTGDCESPPAMGIWGLCSDLRPCEVRGQSWALRLGSVPRTRKPGLGGVPGASCGGTPGGTPRPQTPLHLDKGPWSPSEAAPTVLHPGQMARSLAELDERRRRSCRCAISRPRWGPGVRKAADSVVCCDAHLPFKWRSPRLGLLMGADQSGFSPRVPAFFFFGNK